MNLLEELEILLETRQPYANGNAEKCYPFVAELIQQLRAAQQSRGVDGGDSAAKVGYLTPEELSAIEADNQPAHRN